MIEKKNVKLYFLFAYIFFLKCIFLQNNKKFNSAYFYGL